MNWTNDTLGGERQDEPRFYVWFVRTSKANWAKVFSLLSRCGAVQLCCTNHHRQRRREARKYFLMLGTEKEREEEKTSTNTRSRRLRRRNNFDKLHFIGYLALGEDRSIIDSRRRPKNPSESPRNVALSPSSSAIRNWENFLYYVIFSQFTNTAGELFAQHTVFYFALSLARLIAVKRDERAISWRNVRTKEKSKDFPLTCERDGERKSDGTTRKP